ncbi:MAG: hypothetical protein WCG83_00605 [Candidatus Peregrinibacteria bacterium]
MIKVFPFLQYSMEQRRIVDHVTIPSEPIAIRKPAVNPEKIGEMFRDGGPVIREITDKTFAELDKDGFAARTPIDVTMGDNELKIARLLAEDPKASVTYQKGLISTWPRKQVRWSQAVDSNPPGDSDAA